MIDQLIIRIDDKDILFMATQTTLFIAEGVRFGDSFAFDPNNRLEIRPFSWKTSDIVPLCLHERELRQLLRLYFFKAAGEAMKEAN